jgi:O-antigen/teichoic acid export membrane protein
MIGVSLPLMLNHLLQTVFFRIDILLLDQLKGATVVGWYSTAYKWIDALLIIPAYFTMALFPLMSRRAEDDRAGLTRAYTTGLRWLVSFALPVAAATTFLAMPLVRVLAGAEFLPHGATALAIMIWFLPFSYVNGLTQYALIALDRQRWITVSFVAAAAFNIVANWLVIPHWSYSGAATVTIFSEIVLLVPFLWGLRDLGAPPLLVLIWRPALATSLMTAAMYGLYVASAPAALTVGLGAAVFLVALVWLGGVTEDDRAVLARLLPDRRPAGPPVDRPIAG